MFKTRHLPWLAGWLIFSLGGLLRAYPAPPKPRITLTVSAAVSLTESLQTISKLYHQKTPNVSIALNLGGSGMLEQQIEEGAPVNVFISAAPLEMNELEAKGLILTGTRENLLANTLVLICPARSLTVRSFKGLLQPQIRRIAIADPESVPAGMYAKQTLQYFKLYHRLRPKLILAGDVRQALAYVETGDVNAGIVYLTEARLSRKVRVVAEAPGKSHQPIIYPVAIIKGCSHLQTARRFIHFLASKGARQAFERRGFRMAIN